MCPECQNCNRPATGNYCSHCGEKTMHDRFTVKNIIYNNIVLPFAEDRKSLPLTVKGLTLHPGSSVRKYIEGNRNSLYASDKFLFLVGTLTTIFTFRYHFFASEFTSSDTNVNQWLLSLFGLEEKKAFLNRFFLYAEEYATLLNIIAIPVFALFSYLLFKKKGYTLGENLILNTYITAQQLFYLLLLVPFLEIFPASKYLIISVYSFIMVIYNVWVYIQFFKAWSFSGISKSILIVFIAYISQFFLNLTIYSAFGIYFQLLDQLKVI